MMISTKIIEVNLKNNKIIILIKNKISLIKTK